jgi:hypothetical protein
VVSIENKQGPLPLPQLPPGAAIVISGPKLLKPTFDPALRIATTPITPGQFAGMLVAELSLPAEATIDTPGVIALSSLMTVV